MRMASRMRSVPSASEFAVYSGVSNDTRHVTLRGEVVDLVRLHLLDDADQVGRVGQVAIVQEQLDVALVRILIQMIDAIGVERRGAALDAVNLIALAAAGTRRGRRHPGR